MVLYQSLFFQPLLLRKRGVVVILAQNKSFYMMSIMYNWLYKFQWKIKRIKLYRQLTVDV